MKYSIFFDESNKLDSEKKYSYYGALGCNSAEIKQLNDGVKKIFTHFDKKSEFHFTEYKNDRNLPMDSLNNVLVDMFTDKLPDMVLKESNYQLFEKRGVESDTRLEVVRPSKGRLRELIGKKGGCFSNMIGPHPDFVDLKEARRIYYDRKKNKKNIYSKI